MVLRKKLQEEGYCADDLDEIVTSAAITLASEFNNGGMKDQLRFLEEICGYTDEEILKLVKL